MRWECWGAVGTNFHFIFCSNETKITVRSQVLSNYLSNSVGVERVFALFFQKKISILRMALISIRLNMRDRQSLCIGNLIKSSVLSQKSVLRIKLFSPFGSILCYVCIMQLKKNPCQAILMSGIKLSIHNDWLLGLPVHKQALAASGSCCLCFVATKTHLYGCTPLIRLCKGHARGRSKETKGDISKISFLLEN